MGKSGQSLIEQEARLGGDDFDICARFQNPFMLSMALGELSNNVK